LRPINEGVNIQITSAGLVDVHAHLVPDWYAEQARDAGYGEPDGMASWPAWSAQAHVEMMDRCGIETAILSLSSPGVHFGDDAAARLLARRVNEFTAETTRDHPGRFGMFVSVPLPDVDGALAEIAYSMDVLGADGVILESNSDGIYLGDSRLEPVFAELDRRGAVVFVHPTSPACWQKCALGRPRPMIEFIFDTARTVSDLLFAGTFDRHARLKMIVPHCGGAIPVLADRIDGFMGMNRGVDDDSPDVIAQLGRLYYDVAGTPFPRQLAALLSLVGNQQILYGSDFPWTPGPLAERHALAFGNQPVAGEPVTWGAATTTNARKLLPQLI
jgi:predicted TIM-barrel fold metal-dependent hydrolase